MTVEVKLCCKRMLWRQVDQYIDTHPQACFGHAYPWRQAIWSCYRLPTVALVAFHGGAIVGVAPWTVMFSPLTGPYLSIAPFASYGDILADSSCIKHLLLAETHRLMRWFGVTYAQVRSYHDSPELGQLRGKTTLNRFITSQIQIQNGVDAVWQKMLHCKTRNQIRKARKLSLRVKPAGDWHHFLKVFAAGTRSLGSPFHGANFFRVLKEFWGDRLFTFVALTADNRPAAAALSIHYRNTAHYVYGQNIHSLRATCANSLTVWTMIENACRQDLELVDLGRSEVRTSAERFKRKWGSKVHTLQETILLIWRLSIPNFNPTNQTFSVAQNLWRKLPEPLTRRLGSLLIRGIA